MTERVAALRTAVLFVVLLSLFVLGASVGPLYFGTHTGNLVNTTNVFTIYGTNGMFLSMMGPNGVRLNDGNSEQLILFTNSASLADNLNDGILISTTSGGTVVLQDNPGDTLTLNNHTLTLSGGANYVGNGVGVFNIWSTNTVSPVLVVASSGNKTNYSVNLNGGYSTYVIIGNNTNVFLMLSSTNVPYAQATILVDCYASTVNSVITFSNTVSTNKNLSTTVSNGWAAVLNIWAEDGSGTNLTVSDAGRYHH